MRKDQNLFKRMIKGAWGFVGTARRFTFNLLFLIIAIGLIMAVFSSDKPKIADNTALVIKPKGVLVEQLTANSFDEVVDEAMGENVAETLLKDVTDAIVTAKDDDRIKVLVMDLSVFAGGRLTKLQDLAIALDEFKSSGKKIITVADSYGQDAYYIAAHSDEVILNKMGAVALEGFGRYRQYYREGLDKLGIDINVFKVGTFKSAIEPYIRNDMSEYAKEANNEWLGDLWQIYLDEVAQARGMKPAELNVYAQEITRIVKESKGDTAQAAIDFGLADKALTRVEQLEYLIGLVGKNEETHSFNQVGLGDYLKTIEADRFGRKAKGDKVAVIVARGTILDGSQPAGKIGGDSTAALIRTARNDEDVKAIVLRVDSGGGSAFASEVIRREFEKARADGKPVVVSMGSVAASGGVWISTSSDQIWAHPSTITGSIGIFGMVPTYQKPLAKYLGVRVDGVSTAPLAGIRLDRELPADIGEAIQANIDRGYQEFLKRVGEARGMTTVEVDKIGQGRVWSGVDAYELGLVDSLGNLNDAVNAAAELANLDEGYAVTYIEKEQNFQERLISQLTAKALQVKSSTNPTTSSLHKLVKELEMAATEFAELNDPNHAYVLSNIETD